MRKRHHEARILALATLALVKARGIEIYDSWITPTDEEMFGINVWGEGFVILTIFAKLEDGTYGVKLIYGPTDDVRFRERLHEQYAACGFMTGAKIPRDDFVMLPAGLNQLAQRALRRVKRKGRTLSTETRKLWQGDPRLDTPWGRAGEVDEIGDGILHVWTYRGSSMSGYYIPNGLLHRIPEQQRDWTATLSGFENWFDDEEGYWAFVVLAFPEHFTASMLQNADEMVDFLEREYRKEERLPADEFPGDLKTGTLP
jgi:hypothetical protein